MFLNADAIITLRDGLETQQQIVTLILWVDKSVSKKPIGLLNVNGFYNHLLNFLDHAVEHKLMPYSMRDIIVSAPTTEQLFEKWQHPPVVSPQITSQEV